MGKKDSFLYLVNEFKPGVSMLQETKLYQKGQFKMDNYCIFENLRGQSEGGGLLTMVHENFEPVLVPNNHSSKMNENILVVEAKLGKSSIRYINAYGVQENSSISEIIEFYAILDQEIEESISNNCLICLQMDANGKLGNEIINGDPNSLSLNGCLLLELISRKSLVIVNASDKCNGIITRMKVKGRITEESVIDYFIVCQELYSLVSSMLVDEERKHVLTRYYKSNGVTKVVKSDHNILLLNICYPWDTQVRRQRVEIFNLRNKQCQADFYRSTNNTDVLSQCLENKDVLTGGKQWLKRMKTLLHQNFRKVRINSQPKKNKVQELLSNKKSDEEITEEIYLRNKSKIIEQIGEMSDHTGNMTRLKMWKVKNKVCQFYLITVK